MLSKYKSFRVNYNSFVNNCLGEKLIIFSDHAKIKIEQRGLTQSQIKMVLENPDFVEPSYGGRMVAEKNFGKLNLRVIYIEENADVIVVTAHWHERKL